LTTTEFVFNSKVHTVTKSLPYKVNYRKEPRISFEIRKKEKHEKLEEFVKKIKKMYKEVKVTLKKSQEIKKICRYRKEAVKYEVGDRGLLSTKDLMWQIRNREIKKLMEKFVEPYKIK